MLRNFAMPSAKTLSIHACLLLAALQIAGCSSRQERADNYYKSGMEYIAKENYAKARVELRNALQLKDDMLQAWRALAQIEEHDKNFGALAGSLRRVVELDPKDATSMLRLAKLYLVGRAYDSALKMTNAAAELQPDNADILAIKAAVLFKLQDAEGAGQEAERALKLDPSNTDARMVLAARSFSKNDSAGALKMLEGVASEHQNDLSVVMLKLNIYNQMGKFDVVETLFRQLITQYPKEPVFRARLVDFYIAHKRLDEAEKELRGVVEAHPDDTTAELNLVNMLIKVKGADAARAELVRRIGAGGNVFPYKIALAKFDFTRGRASESIESIRSIVSESKSPDEILTAKITLAEFYIGRQDFVGAEPVVTDILQTDSRNVDGLRLRAAIKFSRGQFEEATENLRRALNEQPRSPLLLSNLATVYERSGSIELASNAYLDAMKASNYSAQYGLNYVVFLQRRGLAPQAESALVELANHNPNNVSVLSNLAKLKLARQDWAAAHTIAEQIRRLGNKHESIIANEIQGAAFSGEKKYSDSLAALQNVYEAAPNAVQPMVAIVATHLNAKQPEKAEAFLKDALKANPDNAEALVLLGSLRLIEKKPEQALEYFNSAIEKQPKSPVGYGALVDFYGRRGKLDEAMESARSGLQKIPNSFALGMSLAGLLEAKRDYEGAIKQYEEMVKIQPGSLIVANNLASLLADHRKDTASLEKAASLAIILRNSDVPQFQDTLGWIAYRRGDYRTAVDLLQDAATKLSRVPLVFYHLGVAYLAVDEGDKAAQQFKKAQELAPNDTGLKTMIDAALKESEQKKKSGEPSPGRPTSG